MNYPSVSIRAAQSGLQSAPACRMQWVCHHLFRSYDRNPSNIANIRLYSVSGHTICCKDKLLFWNLQEKGRFFSIIKYHEPEYTIKKSFTILFFIRILETSGASQNRLSQSYHNNSYHSFSNHFLKSQSKTNYRYNIIIYIISIVKRINDSAFSIECPLKNCDNCYCDCLR